MPFPTRVSRREFVQLSGLAAGLAVGTVGPPLHAAGLPAGQPAANRDADSVLTQLLEGNKRFVRGEPAHPRRKPEDLRPSRRGRPPWPSSSAVRTRG